MRWRRLPFLWAVVPALLWCWLFYHLHFEWSLNPQYNYGWGVPFLAAFLFYLRCASRPAPQPHRFGRFECAATWLLLAVLLPIRAVEEANPDWRLLSWTLGLIVVAFSMLSIWRCGGRPWVSHFAFAICFPLVAIPWPVQWENLVVQNLARAVAHSAVEIASWCGVGALQLGNVIQLHNGFVGVNEACSGVKTLQAAIMVALLFGELLLLPLGRRMALLLAGCVWVFVCNIIRATILVLIAARDGTEALGRYHDGIGTLVLILGMAGLGAIAWCLRAKGRTEFVRTEEVRSLAPRIPFGWKQPLAATFWLAIVFGATEVWYRVHEQELIDTPRWEIRAPNESQSLPIPEETRAILRYNAAEAAEWKTSDGAVWWSFYARWEPQRAALQLVRSHSPEICLPAVGRTYHGELPRVVVETAGLPLTFRAYQFEQGNRPLFVFVCIQEDKIARTAHGGPAVEWNAGGRLLAAWRGQRNLGQRLLEVAVVGLADFDQAREAVARMLREIVKPAEPTG